MAMKKQLLEKVINGRTMRYALKYNVWVNREGTFAYREYKDSSLNCPLRIYSKPDNSKYLNTKSHGEIPLDEAVAICFKSMPKDGNKYKLIHKDGNLGNCHASNLDWVQLQTNNNQSPNAQKKLRNDLVVKRSGKIYDAGKLLPVETEVGDRDTDRIVAIEPLVRYIRKNRFKNFDKKSNSPDELMAAAGFVNGDKSSMSRPRVLHRDKDYLNFNADNLEWAEESSQEYQDYLKKKREDMDALTIKLNPGHPNPLMKFNH